MQIREHIKTLRIAILQRHPITNRAQIIAEMQIASRLNARENAVHLNVQILNLQRVADDEIAARLDHIAHQR